MKKKLLSVLILTLLFGVTFAADDRYSNGTQSSSTSTDGMASNDQNIHKDCKTNKSKQTDKAVEQNKDHMSNSNSGDRSSNTRANGIGQSRYGY